MEKLIFAMSWTVSPNAVSGVTSRTLKQGLFLLGIDGLESV
jgi:hypothetical protein